MRVVFVNLHCNAFLLRPLRYFLTGRPSTYKHRFFLRYLIENEKEWAVYINRKGSVFGRLHGSRFFPLLFRLECMLCLALNGINPFRVRMFSDPEKSKDSDLVFVYIHYVDELEGLDSLKGKKVVHMNHFCAREGIERNAAILSKVRFDAFASESDLSERSAFFREHFGFLRKPTLLLPYTYQERFRNRTPFEERTNRAVATGSLLKDAGLGLEHFFQGKCLHPMRLAIFENRESLSGLLDSLISDYLEDVPRCGAKGGWFGRLRGWYTMNFVMGRQKRYRSFDIVAKYNEYRMSVVPEEVIGLPAIGFVESMACGCAYIGLDHSMYRDIGLVPGRHYIAYDGTLPGLAEAIRLYRNRPEALRRIAEEGCRFVREHFDPQAVAARFYSGLTEL